MNLLHKSAGDMGEAQNIVNEMMALLPSNLPKPRLKIVNQSRSGWLGRDTWQIKEVNSQAVWEDTTLIELQKSILADEETLRRVIAHELCHHWYNLTNGAEDLKKMGFSTYKIYNKMKDPHGAEWREYASVFNARYGKDFVTRKSDEHYILDADHQKEFFILLKQMPNGHIHWQVSYRLSPKQNLWIATHKGREEYRLTKSKDPRFANAPSIASWGWSYAKHDNEEKKELLKELWDGAPVSKTSKLAKTTAKHATTQINLPDEMAWKIRKAVREIIPQDILMEDGYEDNLHITVKYGVDDVEQKLIDAVADQGPFIITFGKLGIFPPSDSSDGAAVVKIAVEAPELLELHDKIDAVMSVKEDDFPYTPHITLAYVKAEEADKYEGMKFIEGVKFEATEITISKKDRVMITVDFGELRKTAGRKDETTSMTMGAEVDGFPAAVVIRWAQGMRWRDVLKSVKRIAGEIAGHRVPWNDIHIFESPWKDQTEQNEQWPIWEARNKGAERPMFDVFKDGTFAQVGGQYTPPAPEPKPHYRTRTTWIEDDQEFPANPRTMEEIEDLKANGLPDETYGDYLRRTKKTSAGIERINVDADGNWKCICGNYAESDGFQPCDADGYVVDPEPGKWDRLWLCDRCARIIDQKSKRVIGQAQKNLFHVESKLAGGKWQCVCGNTEGFSPADANGPIANPSPTDWFRKLWACDKCHRVIDQTRSTAASKTAEKIKSVRKRVEDRDDAETYWFCICGNNDNEDGFSPSDSQGRYVDWNNQKIKFYVCNRCKRVINLKTLDVVGQGQAGLFHTTGSHKTPPLSDTEYENPEIGEETNAYANIPERVKGTTLTPSLSELTNNFKTASGIPSLDALLQYGGGVNEAQGGWDKITEDAKSRTPNWDAMRDDERDAVLDQVGMEYLERTWNEAETRLKSLKFPLTVYRAVCAADLRSIKRGLGIYWSYSESNAYVDKELVCDTTLVFQGSIRSQTDVDWMRTSWSNLCAADEQEVDVLPGANIQIIGWKKKGETKWRKPPKSLQTVYASKTAASERNLIRFPMGQITRQQITDGRWYLLANGSWAGVWDPDGHVEHADAADWMTSSEINAAVRFARWDAVDIDAFPTNQQLAEIFRILRGTLDVIWDLGRDYGRYKYNGEGSASEFRRALDKFYSMPEAELAANYSDEYEEYDEAAKTSAYAEAQNSVQHTPQEVDEPTVENPYGMYKTPKTDPFEEEIGLFADKNAAGLPLKYKIHPKGSFNSVDLHNHSMFLLGDGSALSSKEHLMDEDFIDGEGKDLIEHHDIQQEIGPWLKAHKAIRLASPYHYQIEERPTPQQLSEIGRLIKDAGGKQVTWDLYVRGKRTSSETGTIGEFRRDIDRVYKQNTMFGSSLLRKQGSDDLYHVTLQRNVDDILEHGLKAELGGDFADDNPPSTFLTEKLGIPFWQQDYAQEYGEPTVVLKVSRKGLNLIPDEQGTHDAGAPAYRVEQDIPASSIKIVN